MKKVSVILHPDTAGVTLWGEGTIINNEYPQLVRAIVGFMMDAEEDSIDVEVVIRSALSSRCLELDGPPVFEDFMRTIYTRSEFFSNKV